LSAALLLRHSLDLEAEAHGIEAAVDAVLDSDELTRDLGGNASSAQVTAAVVAALTSPRLASQPQSERPCAAMQ